MVGGRSWQRLVGRLCDKKILSLILDIFRQIPIMKPHLRRRRDSFQSRTSIPAAAAAAAAGGIRRPQPLAAEGCRRSSTETCAINQQFPIHFLLKKVSITLTRSEDLPLLRFRFRCCRWFRCWRGCCCFPRSFSWRVCPGWGESLIRDVAAGAPRTLGRRRRRGTGLRPPDASGPWFDQAVCNDMHQFANCTKPASLNSLLPFEVKYILK